MRAVLAAVLVLGVTPVATAADVTTALVVEGPADVRTALAQAVRGHAKLADDAALAAALQKNGARLAAVGDDAKPDALVPLRNAARDAGATALVTALVTGARGKQAMMVLVVSVENGEVLGSQKIPMAAPKAGKKKARTDQDAVAEAERVIATALSNLSARSGNTTTSWGDLPAWAAPAPSASTPPAAKSSSPPTATAARPAAASEPVHTTSAKPVTSSTPAARVDRSRADLGLAFVQGSRKFGFGTRTAQPLRPYSPGLGAPGPGLEARIYPMAFTGDTGLLGDLGLDVAYHRTIGAKSSVADKPDIDVTWQTWHAGVRMRFAVARPLELGVGLAYGQNDFTFSTTDAALRSELPAAKYQYIRLGGEAKLRLSPIEVTLGGAWDPMLKTGPVGSRFFPDASAYGLEGYLGVSYAIIGDLSARVVGRYERVSIGKTGATSTARDQFFKGELGITYAL